MLENDPSRAGHGAMSAFPDQLFGAEVTLARCAVEIPDPSLRITGSSPELELRATRDQAHLRVSGIGVIAAEGGRRVWIDPASEAATTELCAWLVSTITAFLLAQQGRFALHSSIVDVNG